MANIKQIVAKDPQGNAVTVNAAVTNLYINEKTNLCLETSTELGGKNINIESMKDIKLKPSDDIICYADHRVGETDEVSLKIVNGQGANDVPVKLKLNAAEMVLTTKDKTGDKSNVFDITVNSNKDERGYLKVRAQAIDLRSESHGGIALQPKGFDSDNNMNKIKFEHGGGDGLEFGTFNTQKTSIFTDEYRVNKDGIWYAVTREKIASDKANPSDSTTSYKYVKQSDDFYDIKDDAEPRSSCSTSDIIYTAASFNGKHSHVIAKEVTTNADSDILINTNQEYQIISVSSSAPEGVITIYDLIPTAGVDHTATESRLFAQVNLLPVYTNTSGHQELADVVWRIEDFIYAGLNKESEAYTALTSLTPINTYQGTTDSEGIWFAKHHEDGSIYEYIYVVKPMKSPSVEINSKNNMKLTAFDKININASKVGIKGTLDFGSSFGFGETDKGILYQKKHTEKGTKKSCDTIKIEYYNNSGSVVTYSDADYETPAVYNKTLSDIASGTTAIAASCSVADIIKLVAYMKNNNLGPWTAN